MEWLSAAIGVAAERLPWAIAFSCVYALARIALTLYRSWEAGTFVHKREYSRLEQDYQRLTKECDEGKHDRDKWRDAAIRTSHTNEKLAPAALRSLPSDQPVEAGDS